MDELVREYRANSVRTEFDWSVYFKLFSGRLKTGRGTG
jgi:hypothetical protein